MLPLTLAVAVSLAIAAAAPALPALPAIPAWTKLATAPHKGKQDDVHFVDARHGWYGNGAGKMFRTVDGGATWTQVCEKPGSFFRAVGFLDPTTGFAGNIGTEYFPGVTDTIPLYRSDDAGATWTPVALPGPPVKGLCAIDMNPHCAMILDVKFFDAMNGMPAAEMPAYMEKVERRLTVLESLVERD